jgi:hypothetical protein
MKQEFATTAIASQSGPNITLAFSFDVSPT